MFYEFKHPLSSDYLTVETGSDFCFPAHIHHGFEFITVTAGEMTVTVDNTECFLKEGEGILIFPNQIHSLKTEKSSSHLLCIFSPNLVSAYTSLIKGKVPVCNVFVPEKNTLCTLKNILGLTDMDILEKKGLLYTLVSGFHKNAKYKEHDAAPDSLLHKIFKFIDDNYCTECTLAELAKSLGYEYTYLSRYFKKIVGISYNDYVNEYRISRVCYLLTNTDRSVLDISGECGFNSLRSLNRNFKERLGVSPIAYRAKGI